MFTTVPLMIVAAVIEYVPVHVLFGMVNGNDTVLEVFAGKVNDGLVKITDCALLHLFG